MDMNGKTIAEAIGVDHDSFYSRFEDISTAVVNCETDAELIKLIDVISDSQLEGIAFTWCLGKHALDVSGENIKGLLGMSSFTIQQNADEGGMVSAEEVTMLFDAIIQEVDNMMITDSEDDDYDGDDEE